MVGECARSRSRVQTIKSLAFLLKVQSSTWHHSTAPADLLFLRKDEILVGIAAKQFHSATTCFLSTNYNIMLASQLQLQEWDLQDITKEERGRGHRYACGEEFEDVSNYTTIITHHSLGEAQQSLSSHKSGGEPAPCSLYPYGGGSPSSTPTLLSSQFLS